MRTLLRALGNNRTALVAVLVLSLPFVAHTVYDYYTAMPSEIAIATGPKQGRYREVGSGLAAAVEQRLGIEVKTVPADGSLEAYRLLRDGKVDFALYQRGRRRFVRDRDAAGNESIRFVANAYSELTHLVVREDEDIRTPADLEGRTVAIGLPHWGEHAISLLVLEHAGLDRNDVAERELDYEQLEKAFDEGSIDAALMTTGVRAPALSTLLRSGDCRLGRIPHVERSC